MKPATLAFILCASGLAQAKPAGESTAKLTSPNFEVRYQKGQTTALEAQKVSEKAEGFYKKLADYLGRQAERKIVISLEGNRGDDPKHKWAYVDTDAGWLHLFRFPEDSYAYETGLSHELVHAFRFEHLDKHGMPPSPAFVFLEEGLSEYLSNQIDPRKPVFANYGYDLELAAGQWLLENEDIPLGTLVDEQFRLRPKCIAQSYTLQPSFLAFVEAKLGRDVIRRLAYAADIHSQESFKSYLGMDFSEFAAKWRTWLLASLKKISNYKALGSEWRTKTPISEMHVCKKGVEF